jgi:hypothetical protein
MVVVSILTEISASLWAASLVFQEILGWNRMSVIWGAGPRRTAIARRELPMHESTTIQQIVQGLSRLAAAHDQAAQILHELVFEIGKGWGIDAAIVNLAPPPANKSPRQSFTSKRHEHYSTNGTTTS